MTFTHFVALSLCRFVTSRHFVSRFHFVTPFALLGLRHFVTPFAHFWSWSSLSHFCTSFLHFSSALHFLVGFAFALSTSSSVCLHFISRPSSIHFCSRRFGFISCFRLSCISSCPVSHFIGFLVSHFIGFLVSSTTWHEVGRRWTELDAGAPM